MDTNIFRHSPAGTLLHVGKGPTAYWAFAPNPLPPDFEWNSALVNALSDADRALGELAGLARTILNPDLFIRPFVRREAALSSRIEGTRADLSDQFAYEVGQLLLPLEIGALSPEDDVKEVYNYVRAMEYGLDRLHSLPMSLRLIR
jgi:Fic family protein